MNSLGVKGFTCKSTHIHCYSVLQSVKCIGLQGVCLYTCIYSIILLVLWSPPLCVEWLWLPPVHQSHWSRLQSTRGVCQWMFQHKGAGRKSVIQRYLLSLDLKWCTIFIFFFFSVWGVTYLSGGGLALVEVIVVWWVRWVKSWLKEHTAQSYRLNGSWTLIGEPKTNKHLNGKQQREDILFCILMRIHNKL